MQILGSREIWFGNVVHKLVSGLKSNSSTSDASPKSVNNLGTA